MKRDSKNHDHGYELPEINPKKPNEMKIVQHKSHVIPMTAILSTAAVLIIFIIGSVAKDAINVYHETKAYNKLDKATYCLQTVMSESQKVGKIIDAQQAKEICKELLPK